MLNKLKELVFGLSEFEKTKIDVRYEFISSMISSLTLNEISDFEILEDCISKIKDQLRIKSSNLNKIISDPTKKLKKREVLDILDRLSKVKYDFLERAFNLIRKDNTALEELKLHAQELDSKIDNIGKNQNPTQDGENKTVYVNDYLKVKVSNGNIPYLIVDFVRDVDYAFLKELSGYLFEEYSAAGSNIIIEKNKAMVVPRFDNDNLFKMPRIDNLDIDEIFKKINERDVSKKVYEEPIISLASKEEEFPEEKDVEKETEYLEIDKKFAEFRTRKFEEDSLDAILMGTEKKRITPKPKPQEDENTVSFEKDDAIEFERKEKEVNEPEIEIEKKELRYEKERYISNKKVNEIYRDDKISVYLNENSRVLGELIIEPLDSTLNESDYSYMWIFSKIFSSVLFEETHSAGTNILMDYSNNKIKIVPRGQDDGVDLQWTPKQESDEFLEQVKTRLLKVLENAIDGKPTDSNKKLEVASGEEKHKKKSEEKAREDKTKEVSSKEKKVNHLLEHLRKIP